MSDRLAELESSVATLSGEVARLRARIESLESGAPASQTGSDSLAAIPEVHVEQVQGWLAVLGRSLVILGGAYLLRALTASQVVSYAAGVGAGLLYGAPWLALAARAGARSRRLDAFAYGASTALIGYPLVWEATVRFGVFTPVQSAMLLGALTAAAFVLSASWRLYSLAAVVACGALVSAAGLAFETQQWMPYTILAIGIGLATLWLGAARGWIVLRWPAALVADVMIVVLMGQAEGRFWPVVLVALAAIAGYAGTLMARTLVGRHRIIPFEVAQSFLLLALVATSLLVFVSSRPAGPIAMGAVLFTAGVVNYLGAFTVVYRDRPSANVYFYSMLALVLVVWGGTITMPRVAPAVFAAAGAAAAIGARSCAPIALSIQATLLTAAAMFASGLAAEATAALTAPPALWTTAGIGGWAALAAGLAAFVIRPPRPGSGQRAISGARLVLAVLVLWTLGGTIVRVLGGGVQDPGWLATLRTIVSVSAALLMAYLSRKDPWHEAAWLTYPLLVVLGLKLLVSDFPAGRPETLFIALAAYGIALIAAPRALRHAASTTLSAT